jgi:hypothetical protein
MDHRYTTAVNWIRERDTRRAWRILSDLQRAGDRLSRTTDPGIARVFAAGAVRDAIALLILAGGNGSDVLRAVERVGAENGHDPDPGGPVGARGASADARRNAAPGEPADPYGSARLDPAAAAFWATSATFTPGHAHYWPNPYRSCTCGEPPPGDPATAPARTATYPDAYADPAFLDAEFTADD